MRLSKKWTKRIAVDVYQTLQRDVDCWYWRPFWAIWWRLDRQLVKHDMYWKTGPWDPPAPQVVDTTEHGFPKVSLPRELTAGEKTRVASRFGIPLPTYPHCDQTVLHAPRTCVYCDMYPDRQNERIKARLDFSTLDANGWAGNKAVLPNK